MSLLGLLTSWWGAEHPAGAVDIIIVEDPANTLQSSPWHVRCAMRRNKGNGTGRTPVVKISINGHDSGVRMKLGEAGEAFFVERLPSNHLTRDPRDEACSPLPPRLQEDATTSPPAVTNTVVSGHSFVPSSSESRTPPLSPRLKSEGNFSSATVSAAELAELSISPHVQRVRSLSVGDYRVTALEPFDEDSGPQAAKQSDQPRRMRSLSDLNGESKEECGQPEDVQELPSEYTWRWGRLPKQRNSSPDLLLLLNGRESVNKGPLISLPASPNAKSSHRRASSSPMLLPSSPRSMSPRLPSSGSLFTAHDLASESTNQNPAASVSHMFPSMSSGSLDNADGNDQLMQVVGVEGSLVAEDKEEQDENGGDDDDGGDGDGDDGDDDELKLADSNKVGLSIDEEQSLQDIALEDICMAEAGLGDMDTGSDSDSASLASLSLDDGEAGGGSAKDDRRRYRFKKSLVPSAEELQALCALLRPGHNDACFELSGAEPLHCSVFLWNSGTRVVATDIEGSVTQGKMARTWGSFLGATTVREHVNPAALDFFDSVKRQGYEILYISHTGVPTGVSSKDFLKKVLTCPSSQATCLPLGPVLQNPELLVSAQARGDLFKLAALRGVRSLFRADNSPFYASFSARRDRSMNERAAMLRCGVPPGRIFLVGEGGTVGSTANGTLNATFAEMGEASILGMRFPAVAVTSPTASGSGATSALSAISSVPDDSFLTNNYWSSSYHLQFDIKLGR